MSQLRLLRSALYLSRHYGFPLRDLLGAWRDAKKNPSEAHKSLFDPQTPVEAMFSYAAHRQFEEAVMYRCVNGTCSVIWHPKRGNIGGMGIPGCSCDDMKDPRDLAYGAIEQDSK